MHLPVSVVVPIPIAPPFWTEVFSEPVVDDDVSVFSPSVDVAVIPGTLVREYFVVIAVSEVVIAPEVLMGIPEVVTTSVVVVGSEVETASVVEGGNVKSGAHIGATENKQSRVQTIIGTSTE